MNIYREPLPEDCPPPQAEEIISLRIVFRIVWNNPPTADDFRSRRAEKPEADFRASECQARGLSVFAQLEDAKAAARRARMIGAMFSRVVLDKGAGHIQKTGRNSHYTWWALADFDILSRCQVVP